MDAKTLRSKFLTLSELYPELYHALIIWDRTDDDLKKHFDDWSLVENDELSAVDSEFMTNDARAMSYYLWHGDVDQQRAKLALSTFRMLANNAAQCIDTREFPGRIAPEFLISAGDGLFDETTGVSRVTMSEPRPGVCDWLGHVFEVLSIDREVVQWHEGEGPKRTVLRSCEVLRLPFNTFESSVWALDVINDDSEEGGNVQSINEARDKWMYDLKTNGKSLLEIRRVLCEYHEKWRPIESDQGVSQAINRYCERHSLPH